MNLYFVPALLSGVVCSPLFALQSDASFRYEAGPATYAGVFHAATGTWTRHAPSSSLLGSDVIYNNSAQGGIFSTGGIEVEPVVFETIDAGRVPSSSGPGNRDRYNINGITINYCVGDDTGTTGPLESLVRIYNRYSTCANPTQEGTVVGEALLTGLPGWDGTTTFSCWIVDVDLSGGSEICLTADGEGAASATIEDDQFGIGITMDPNQTGGFRQAGVPVGPVVAGNRDWTSGAPGEHALQGMGGTGGGGGTYYGPAEICTTPGGALHSSGYDNLDTWWVTERPNIPTGTGLGADGGCYWFGGYNGAAGCDFGPGEIPTASLWMVLQADTSTDCVEVPIRGGMGEEFCNPANSNTSGVSALATARVGATANELTGVALEVDGGPPGEMGYFLVGTGQDSMAPLSIGDGNLCLSIAAGQQIGRYNLMTGSGSLNSMGQFDAFGLLRQIPSGDLGFEIPVNLPFVSGITIMSGQTMHFQLWHRDSSMGVGSSNFSSGVSVTFE